MTTNTSSLDDQDHVTPVTSLHANASLADEGDDHHSNDSRAVNPEAALLRRLLRDYDRNAKPELSDGGAIQVYIAYYLGRISNLVSHDVKRNV